MRRSGQDRGRFASDVVLSKGSLARRVDAVGCFASDAEFSKGCRHFASVITLAKCGTAVKPEASLSKQTPSRAPRPPGRRGSHWGTLAALGQVSPHWGRLLTCPNDPLPTPNAPLPTPMTRCIPPCTVAYPKCTAAFHNCTVVCPNAGLHPSMTAQRPSQQPRSRRPPSPPSPRGPVPASADLPNPGYYGSGRFPSCSCVLALRLLQHGAAQCEVERAESHQWTRAAVAFPTSARSLYKPAHTDRRSLWMSPPSHKALRAPTTTAPPEYEESGPALIG